MSLKDRIRELRGSEPQSRAAKRCGISQPMWSKLERGESSETALLPQIARAYNVSLNWLAYGEGGSEHDLLAETGTDYLRLRERVEQHPALKELIMTALSICERDGSRGHKLARSLLEIIHLIER